MAVTCERVKYQVEFEWIEAWDGGGHEPGWYLDEYLWDSRDSAQRYAIEVLHRHAAVPMADDGNVVDFRIKELVKPEGE